MDTMNTSTKELMTRYDELLENLKQELLMMDEMDDCTQELSSLMELALLVGQLDDTDGWTPCTRVIRLKTKIPRSYLTIHHYNPILVNGYYLPVEGIIIPAYIMRMMEVCSGTKKILNPYKISDKLVPGYNYGTTQLLSDGRGFALKSDTPIERYVNISRKYEYFDLKVAE